MHSGISEVKVQRDVVNHGWHQRGRQRESWRGVPALTCTDLKNLYKSASYSFSVHLKYFLVKKNFVNLIIP